MRALDKAVTTAIHGQIKEATLQGHKDAALLVSNDGGKA